MKTLNQDQKWSAGLKTNLHTNEGSGPRIGDADGISDRAMNFLIVLFMLLTVGVAVVSANPTDEVKYRILLRQAMLDIDRMEYGEAITKLLEVRANTEESANVNHLLGKCYLYGEISTEKAVFYLNRAAENASTEYESWDLDETRAPIETFYLLAKAYEQTEHFDMAAQFYGQFLASLDEDKLNASSRTYRIINRSVEQCQIAAAQQGNTFLNENIVLNK